jgi:hypothetical protein
VDSCRPDSNARRINQPALEGRWNFGLEREKQQYEAKLAVLRAAIDEGDASGIAKGNAFDRVRKTLDLRTKRR